jgi:hypothetical protein
MKKFPIKSLAVAASFACAGVVLAGSLAGSDATAPKYAVEALTASTPVTIGSVTYTMGVARASATGGTSAQDFTVVVTPSTGAAFDAASCDAVLPQITGSGTATVSVKRKSTSECAYQVAVTAPLQAGSSNFVIAPLKFGTHTLNVAGNTAGVTVNLWDATETSRIDNAGALSRITAIGSNAISMTSAADTATVADVNYIVSGVAKPLMGFVAGGAGIADTVTVAKAQFSLVNGGAQLVAAGNASYNYPTSGGLVAVTVVGNYAGVSGATVTKADGTALLTVPAVTINAAKTSASFNIDKGDVGAAGAGTTTDYALNLTADGVTSLGTSRVFGISAIANPSVGSAVTLAGSSAWWTWSANAIQLMSPYFSTDTGSGVLTRFFFTNSGSAAATYTASCIAESGVTSTAGTAASGSLNVGLTMVKATDICSFSTGIRGAVTFTINAPAGNLKGVYNLGFNANSSSFLPLTRPYGATNAGNASVE